MFDRGAVEGWDPKAKAMPVVGARALLFLFALPAHFRLKLRLLRSKVESSRESSVSWLKLSTYIYTYIPFDSYFYFLFCCSPFRSVSVVLPLYRHAEIPTIRGIRNKKNGNCHRRGHIFMRFNENPLMLVANSE